MKNLLQFRSIILAFLGVFLFCASSHSLYAQDVKKNKVRLKADYVKIMDGESYLDITATSKIDKKNIRKEYWEIGFFALIIAASTVFVMIYFNRAQGVGQLKG